MVTQGWKGSNAKWSDELVQKLAIARGLDILQREEWVLLKTKGN
jgi:hypothetical protein